MKSFVTLFNSQNVHLIKDVGLIPYGMQQYGYYDSYIATYDNGGYSHLEDAVKGLKLWYVKKITGSFLIDSVFFLLKNGRKIDVLNLYHSTFHSALFSFFYKVVNPSGRIYLKLDGGCTKEETPWYKSFRGYTIKKADLITTELQETSEKLSLSWNKRISLLRNPYHPNDLKEYRPYNNRKRTIITVGRIGTTQKSTETLLNAFLSIADKIPDWNLLLVGPVEQSFYQKLEKLFSCYSSLKERIMLYGNVENRDELMNLYDDAKIFVFPSRWESYGIALMEAGLCGTFQVCSELLSSKELTNNYRFAAHFPVEDVNALAGILLEVCKPDTLEIEKKGKLERLYIINTCSLKKVCESLNQMLNS